MFENVNHITVNGRVLDAEVESYEDSFNIVCNDEESRLFMVGVLKVHVSSYDEVDTPIPIVVYKDDEYILVTPKWMRSAYHAVVAGNITFSGCTYARYDLEGKKPPVVDTTKLLYDEVKRDVEWLRRMIRNHGPSHPMTPMFEEMLIKKQELLTEVDNATNT